MPTVIAIRIPTDPRDADRFAGDVLDALGESRIAGALEGVEIAGYAVLRDAEPGRARSLESTNGTVTLAELAEGARRQVAPPVAHVATGGREEWCHTHARPMPDCLADEL